MLEAFPFFSRIMELVLSWKKTLSKDLIPWDFIKYRVQQITGMNSSESTRSVSVELRVLNFCFVELTVGNPLPKDNPPPECPGVLGWIAKDASTHNFKITLLLTLRMSGSSCVPLMYLIMWTILSQSYRSGAFTLVVRNSTAVQVSGLARLVEYKVFATRLWKCTVLLCGTFLQSLLTLKIFSGSALVFVYPLGFRLFEIYKYFF